MIRNKWGWLCVFLFIMTVFSFGCAKKAQEGTLSQTGLGLEGQEKDIATQTITSPEAEQQAQVQAQAQAQAAAAGQTQPIEVSPKGAQAKTDVSATPAADMDRNRQIQTALKNANLYFGEVDGKIGHMTKKAIEEFQQSKGLKADGKVGPKTWAELQKYLTATAPDATQTKATTGTSKKR